MGWFDDFSPQIIRILVPFTFFLAFGLVLLVLVSLLSSGSSLVVPVPFLVMISFITQSLQPMLL